MHLSRKSYNMPEYYSIVISVVAVLEELLCPCFIKFPVLQLQLFLPDHFLLHQHFLHLLKTSLLLLSIIYSYLLRPRHAMDVGEEILIDHILDILVLIVVYLLQPRFHLYIPDSEL